jgi:hypothetical protein
MAFRQNYSQGELLPSAGTVDARKKPPPKARKSLLAAITSSWQSTPADERETELATLASVLGHAVGSGGMSFAGARAFLIGLAGSDKTELIERRLHIGRMTPARVDTLLARMTAKAPAKGKRQATRKQQRSPLSPEQVASRIAANADRARGMGASEAQIHVAVIDVLKALAAPGVIFWHTPNGEYRHPSVASKLKAMGVVPGLPDLFLFVGGRLHCLELKRRVGGAVSPEQKAMLAALEGQGAVIAIGKGYVAALAILEGWGVLAP